MNMRFTPEVFDLKNVLNPGFSVAGLTGSSVGVLLGAIYGDSKLNMYVGLLLIAVVFFDWLGAIGAATKDGSYSSEYGIRGIIRTTIVLMLPQVGRIMDAIAGQVVVLGIPLSGFYLFISFGLIYNTWMSMTANFSRAGFDKWIPNWMLEAVASEIRAKITRSEGRREAIKGNQVEISSFAPAASVAPLNESQRTLVNSDVEKEKTNIK